MIYDCFLFFNELELLELRLNELHEVVDKFVLVESTRTFQGESKRLYFEENKHRYRRFLHKVIHVIDDEGPDGGARVSPWEREYHQRNMIQKGLGECKPGDIVIVSDVDEIPNPGRVLEYRNREGIKIFVHRLFYYFLNCEAVMGSKSYRWLGSAMCHYRDVSSPQRLRNLVVRLNGLYGGGLLSRARARAYWALLRLRLQRKRVIIVENGGWHFSYLGGAERIVEKIEAFAHSEYNRDEFKNPRRIEELMRKGRDLFNRDIEFKVVEMDETFPAYLRENVERFGGLIRRRDED